MERILLAVVLVAASCLADAAQGSFVIARRGERPAFRVVVEKNASTAEKYAASEFSAYVAKLTDVTLPVAECADSVCSNAVLICTRPAPGCKADGFRLKVENGRLVICGNSPRGALYAVYETLERFGGCGWFSSWTEVVPRLDVFSVPADLDERHEPAFELREAMWRDAYKPDFAARLKLNGNSMHLTGKHGGLPYGFSTNLWNGHTFHWLVDPQKHFNAHPEWFSEVGGRRIKEKTQLCLSNPEVLALAISNTFEAIRLEPDAKCLGIGHMDWKNYCTCASCRAVDEEEGSPMGSQLRFVNAIADAVGARFPDKLICTEAYGYTIKAPRITRPRENVLIELCPLDSDFSRPLSDPAVPKNRAFMPVLDAWLATGAKLCVYHYAANFGNYPAPYANIPALAQDIRMFADRGIPQMFVLGAYQGVHEGFSELELWLTAKLMWNPHQQLEPLLDRFFAAYYGKGAAYARQAFDLLNALERDHVKRPLTAFDDIAADVYTDKFLDDSTELWRRAARCVEDDPEKSYNVRMSAFGIDYIRFWHDHETMQARRLLDFRDPPDADGKVRRFRELAASLASRMDEALKFRHEEIRCCENTSKNARMGETIRAAAHFGALPSVNGVRTVPAEEVFKYNHGDGRCVVAEDVSASGGKAFKVNSHPNAWPAKLPAEYIAAPPGTRFNVCLRMKTAGHGGNPAKPLKVCLYDGAAGGSVKSVEFDIAPDDSNWQWLELGEWTPAAGDYMFIVASPTHPVLIDDVEFKALSIGYPPYDSRSFVEGVKTNATGFFRVEELPDPANGKKRWWAIDPLGRGMNVFGIDHVRYEGMGVRGGKCRYLKHNQSAYPDKSAWESETLGRLTDWGFNLFGVDGEPSLLRRGLAHAILLNMGDALARRRADPDEYISSDPGRPCSAMPNMFSPRFAEWCDGIARRKCLPNKDDPWLFGYYIDNELAWHGGGERDRQTGLWDRILELPSTHSARRALSLYAKSHGVPETTNAVPAQKSAFIRLAAERYFRETTAAIRRYDPNHLILGCRFATLEGAPEQVWEVAGKFCDIVSMNIYPAADLQAQIVRDWYKVPILESWPRYHRLTARPMMLTEWSFCAYDSGLPCKHGPGQRFKTQQQRAQAAELLARTVLSMPFMVGYSFFMWVDDPPEGFSSSTPEDSNYGLVNEQGKPYPAVETFRKIQRRKETR